MKTANVFNIERFATEDGPGIRTLVFLKGCALRCKWCANPESQLFEKEIMFNGNACIGCGKCIESCELNAVEYIEGFGFITDNKKCNQCMKCIDNCYQNARTLMGKEYTVDELVEEVLKDEEYFKTSNGGVTFSGGEPLFYAEFIEEFSKLMKDRGISVLIETCGHIPLENIKLCAPYVDMIFYDFKHIDSQKHKEFTGAGNEKILYNLCWLNDNFKGNLSVRYPYIPGCNDKKEDIEGFLEYVSRLKNIKEVWFLPYHRLGLPKYQGLGRKYEMDDMESLKMKDIEFLKEYQKKYNITIRI
ncbi:MAG: glycyl-radical enzyme activating protein [Acutalibacteraceae bacterium]|jgi:pyruvate formate lyase activating enzyme|nr:glycyl-radical enzyme activating protein [Clostridiales bacterium]